MNAHLRSMGPLARFVSTPLIAAAVLALGACSSSGESDENTGDDPQEAATSSNESGRGWGDSGENQSASATDPAESAGDSGNSGASEDQAESGEPAEATAADGSQGFKKPDTPNRFAPGGPIGDGELGKYYVTMSCAIDGEDVGTMAFDLWTDAAPITTRNFLRLVDTGFYDGVAFHRILRDFMIQGGDPTGTGAGDSPFGTINAEFSREASRAHKYGVLSMARMGHDINSGGAQFFLCCDDNPKVWGLDGSYASFGRLTDGVDTLEKLASVRVSANRRGEVSVPQQNAVITDAEVHEGEPPSSGEVLERKAPVIDLGGEPERVLVQRAVIAFDGSTASTAKRTQVEAEELAKKILKQVQAGVSMDELVVKFTAENLEPGDETPGVIGLLNHGVRDRAAERAELTLEKEFRSKMQELSAQMRAGEIEMSEAQKRENEIRAEVTSQLPDPRYMPRERLDAALGEAAFKMSVGEVVYVPYNARTSEFGFQVVKRIE